MKMARHKRKQLVVIAILALTLIAHLDRHDHIKVSYKVVSLHKTKVIKHA